MPEHRSFITTTGSTGRLGGRVARRLAAAGTTQRLLVRDPSRAPELEGSEVVQAEYGDGLAVRAALEGADVVFMVSGAEHPDRVDQHRGFVDAAVDAGASHLVYTSFYRASPLRPSPWPEITGPRRSTSGRAVSRSRSCGTTCMPTSCR